MWPDKGEETELDQASMGGLPQLQNVTVQQFRLTVAQGAEAGQIWTSSADGCSIGSHPSNDLVLTDRTVSRFHCEIRLRDSGARLRDMESRNGTVVDGVRVADGWLKDGSRLRLGQTELCFNFGSASNPLPLSGRTTFGTLLGRSVAMRQIFALLERAASSTATVLLEGETGTGKEEAAISLHEESPRKKGPFVVVDCSAIHANLLESELFGHEKGAFTGAMTHRIGAFEAASGGTVFLDEIGELPSDLQPKLLRVLERRMVRPLGGNEYKKVDVRVVAATNRNLRTEVNEGRLRPDVYYRLAVIKVTLPPLRERPDDIPVLLDLFLENLGADGEASKPLLEPAFLAMLQHAAWPGNIRQLRNYVEQCLVLQDSPPLAEAPPATRGEPTVDARLSYAEARRRALDGFERRYLEALLGLHGNNVSQAARAAEVNRAYLHRLLRRHGLRK